jgi:hypothetical protein
MDFKNSRAGLTYLLHGLIIQYLELFFGFLPGGIHPGSLCCGILYFLTPYLVVLSPK